MTDILKKPEVKEPGWTFLAPPDEIDCARIFREAEEAGLDAFTLKIDTQVWVFARRSVWGAELAANEVDHYPITGLYRITSHIFCARSARRVAGAEWLLIRDVPAFRDLVRLQNHVRVTVEAI
jgi:hypothetical protein